MSGSASGSRRRCRPSCWAEHRRYGDDVLSHRLTDDAELRPLEPWQATDFAAFVDAHRAHLDPWVPLGRAVTDEVSAHRFLTTYAERAARDDGRIYGIWLAGDLVGGTVFRQFDAVERTCELGVWLSPSATGQGLVTRACTVMIDWAFRVRGLVRAEWRVVRGNLPSVAVARRLGMSDEGVLRSATGRGGGRADVEVWSILAHEWDPRHI